MSMNPSLINPKFGISITGILMGYRSENSGQFTNHYIGVQVAEMSGDYGQIEHVIHDIEIYKDHLNYVPQSCNQLQGKMVRIWFYPKVLFGISSKNKPYGFLKRIMLKDTYIEEVFTPEGKKV